MKTNWKPKHIERWRKRRAQGRLRFVLVYGVLVWGMWMAVFSAGVRAWEKHRADFLTDPAWIAVHLTQWAVAGVFFGVWMWWVTERNYRRACAETGVDPEGPIS